MLEYCCCMDHLTEHLRVRVAPTGDWRTDRDRLLSAWTEMATTLVSVVRSHAVLEATKMGLDKRVEELTQEVDRLRSRRDDGLRRELAEARNHVVRLTEELKRLTEEHRRLTEEHRRLTEEHAKLTACQRTMTNAPSTL